MPNIFLKALFSLFISTLNKCLGNFQLHQQRRPNQSQNPFRLSQIQAAAIKGAQCLARGQCWPAGHRDPDSIIGALFNLINWRHTSESFTLTLPSLSSWSLDSSLGSQGYYLPFPCIIPCFFLTPGLPRWGSYKPPIHWKNFVGMCHSSSNVTGEWDKRTLKVQFCTTEALPLPREEMEVLWT